MAESILVPGVSSLDGPELEITEHDDWSGHCQPQSELADTLRRAELGQDHQHPPLAAGIDDVARESPGEVATQRERPWCERGARAWGDEAGSLFRCAQPCLSRIQHQ